VGVLLDSGVELKVINLHQLLGRSTVIGLLDWKEGEKHDRSI
jgi:hypothetical protein